MAVFTKYLTGYPLPHHTLSFKLISHFRNQI
jgi:hypothetical protein